MVNDVDKTVKAFDTLQARQANDFNTVTEFELQVACFFGASYAVAVDSCTHGLELCLRLTGATGINVPKNTYLSVPMLANKLGIYLSWREHDWRNHYTVSPRVIDAAVLWRKNSYIPGTFMCLSFQYQKHLSLGRGGMILCDSKEEADLLRMMSYDGRKRGIPWREQDVLVQGYHYYMTPEIAKFGLEKMSEAMATTPRVWTIQDWPDISKYSIFRL